MKLYFNNLSGVYQNRFDYVVNFITNHPIAKKQITLVNEKSSADISIEYGGTGDENSFNIPTQKFIFSNDIINGKALSANKYQIDKAVLYSVEEGEDKSTKQFLSDQSFGFDIVETIFYHLSRYEEYYCATEKKDRWDMMDEEEMFLVHNKLEQKAVVDDIVVAFYKALGLKLDSYPVRYRMTHDIDLLRKFKSIFSFARFNLYYLKNNHGLKSLKNLWSSYLKVIAFGKRPYEVFDEMLISNDIEKEIYFLVGGKTSVDTPLDMKSMAFKKAVDLSLERGYKIGIHPSYDTWKNTELLEIEKQKLEEYLDTDIRISRQHYLHFSFQKSIEILEKAGIVQDSTIGFNKRIGFRAGTGEQFFLYDFNKDESSKVKEAPLIFMDSSLFVQSNFKETKFTQIAESFLEENNENSCITFNFHNSRFDDAAMFDLPLQELYKKVTG